MNTRSLSRVMARNIFGADAARVQLSPVTRYAARAQDYGWTVWDQERDEAVAFMDGLSRETAERAAEVYNIGLAKGRGR